MALMRKYSFRNYQLMSSEIEGFSIDGTCIVSEESGIRRAYLTCLDGAQYGAAWGRLHFEYEMDEENVVLVRAAAVENKVPAGEQKRLFEKKEPSVNHKDVLLFGESGRYLYLMFEVLGSGKASIREITVLNPGDNFLNTFPDIYRKNNGSFHRFLSVFSSIYNDFDEEIEKVHSLLDIDTAPVGFLRQYADWLGIRLNNSISLEVYRNFLKEAYELNSMKGTVKAFKRIVKLITGKECKVVERVFWSGDYLEENREMLDGLYGRDDTCVTVIIEGKREKDTESALLFMLRQFKPARVNVSVVYEASGETMDSYSFLSKNARIKENQKSTLDEQTSIGQGIVIQ
ncbi:MAG: hypothetical protein K6G84_07200 [Lachnospiraceae bacterium]|nr:hypothetical protein [Lachnospiraceae bacterium]